MADIVLIGVSRTSKTPLSIYLSQQGLKVANVPLDPQSEPPREIWDVDKTRLFGLMTTVEVLRDIRKRRIGTGIAGMGDLIIVTMLSGGMLEVIRENGGIDYLVRILTKGISGKRGAEFSIAALVSMANVCTANNTIAILTTGRIAKDITTRFGLDPRKTASILDTFSCMIQGLLPYGAQMLMASGLAGISSLSIIKYLFYPYTMGAFAVLAILLRYPRKYS